MQEQLEYVESPRQGMTNLELLVAIRVVRLRHVSSSTWSKSMANLAKEKRSSMVKQILQIMSNMHQAWTCLQHQVTKCWQTDCQELEDATERPTSSLFLNRGWSWLSTTGPKLLCGHDIAIGPTNQSQTSKLNATPKLQVWFSRNDSVRVATELFDYFDDHPK